MFCNKSRYQDIAPANWNAPTFPKAVLLVHSHTGLRNVSTFSYFQISTFSNFQISLNFPIQTLFPCSLLTRNMIPTKMKKSGPKNPSNAINRVP